MGLDFIVDCGYGFVVKIIYPFEFDKHEYKKLQNKFEPQWVFEECDDEKTFSILYWSTIESISGRGDDVHHKFLRVKTEISDELQEKFNKLEDYLNENEFLEIVESGHIIHTSLSF